MTFTSNAKDEALAFEDDKFAMRFSRNGARRFWESVGDIHPVNGLAYVVSNNNHNVRKSDDRKS